MGDAVHARLAGARIGDVAGDDPAVAVVAHAEAFVEARELAGAVVELLLLEGVGLADEIEGPAEQPGLRRAPCVDGEPSGSGKSGATSNFMTSTTILPSSVS